MENGFQRVLNTFLVALIAVNLVLANDRSSELSKSTETYNEALAIATASAPAPQTVTPPLTGETEPVKDEPYVWREAPIYGDSYMDYMCGIDLLALREKNPDVIGWISIPDTAISYPLMYGGDNEFYLKHTWLREPNYAGSIFIEQYCNTDLRDFNTIIYGHRIKGDIMFTPLKNYSSEEYLKSHPYIYIADDNGVHRYEVFSAYETPITSDTYRIGIKKESHKQLYINLALENSVIDTGIIPTTNDKILTLSTCPAQGDQTRWIVQAVLHAAD
ncbi:MAG: class B sortase [Oscillospiraceae bacterium]|nr:class B sortase [Oscillospiraceae bacterium]